MASAIPATRLPERRRAGGPEGFACALAALIPLWPYFAWDVAAALPISLAATAVTLFALGLAKGKVARPALIRSRLHVLLIGGASAGIGCLIGISVAA